MTPPYQITPEILKLIASISEKIGQINAKFLDKPSPKLRKENRIKTIHSSLSIEGNTLTEEQITALIDNKRIIGPEKDVNEVLNAIRVYDQLQSFDPKSSKSFLNAHEILMKGLVSDNGKYRKTGVGIMAGHQIAHMAPPAENVPHLMNDLFGYLKTSKEISLIKSCVFHYEMEFIHPFIDGNGRMGRLWQTLILMKEYPVFEFIPFENIIHKSQSDYYHALSQSDKSGSSTPFIEYMLKVVNDSLHTMLDFKSRVMSTEDRLAYFSEICEAEFSRKDYMSVFKEISSATASRDLKQGVQLGLFEKEGDKTKTIYRIIK
ncbi:MAG: Fic family protein [Cryomorphaceae bacterium]|jgi:Fic family protein|nr:Fic family protein [Cryomorphaceae bacterium]